MPGPSCLDWVERASKTMSADTEPLTAIDIAGILELLPHRYPMLLVDRVEDLVPGERAVGIKNVTFNEPFFQGHFPGHPVMPGVLIVEALAQTAAVVALASMPRKAQGQPVYFMSISDARFRRPVGPGDTLRLQVEKDKVRQGVWRFIAKALVDDKVVAEAKFSAAVPTG